MRYLITGGAGFIGSHLTDYLIAEGHKVHVVDDLSTGSLDNIRHLLGHENFSTTIGDILDYHMLEQIVSPCDQIIHLAAKVGVRLIMEQPVDTIVTNVQGTENILKLADLYKKKVLIASTSEVYGKSMETDDSITKLSEDNDWTLGPTQKRRWAYAGSKAIDEFLAFAYASERDLKVVIARFFNTVGPRQAGRYGMVIPNFVQQALEGKPIRVFGDGNQTRCFTHVQDAVRAIVGLLSEPAAEGELFNIGSEEEISMNELAEKVRAFSESSSEIVNVPYEEVYGPGFEDMMRRTPDISKISAAIGYSPRKSIDDIVRDVIDFYQNDRVEDRKPVSSQSLRVN